MATSTPHGFYDASDLEIERVHLRQDLRDEMNKRTAFEMSLATLRPGTSKDVQEEYRQAIEECNSMIRYLKQQLRAITNEIHTVSQR
jgi:hypothetical protein